MGSGKETNNNAHFAAQKCYRATSSVGAVASVRGMILRGKLHLLLQTGYGMDPFFADAVDDSIYQLWPCGRQAGE